MFWNDKGDANNKFHPSKAEMLCSGVNIEKKI